MVTDQPSEIVLEPILDFRAAAPLRDVLLERRGSPLVIDASQVQQLGGLCLQVLLATQQAWKGDQAEFSIAGRSSAFQQALDAFGASGAFDHASFAE